MRKEIKIEMDLLNSWKVRIGLLLTILSPAITAVGAYYNLKSEITTQVQTAQIHIDQTYSRKESIDDIKDNLKEVKVDIKDIKDYLLKSRR